MDQSNSVPPFPSFLSYTSPGILNRDDTTEEYLIFFITGNPGLIEYYEPFLSKVASLLPSTALKFHILGHSLAGFETKSSHGAQPGLPYSLEQQILFVESLLVKAASEHHSHYDAYKLPGMNPVKTILIGHSVGSYILLELIKRQTEVASRVKSHCRIIGGILLFPTITHIAQSPSGLKLVKIINIPRVPFIIGKIAKTLVRSLPRASQWLVRTITGFTEQAADVTLSFLRSDMGVHQALHMAFDEMKTIAEDRWDDSVWGASRHSSSSAQDRAQLVFYFGRKDHWVADRTRDDLIAARGRTGGADGVENRDEFSWKPLMLVDQGSIPHSFCIAHNDVMAEKVSEWIQDMVAR